MDKTSLEYCSYNLLHAMSNGFYRTTNPNKKAIDIYKTFKTNSIIKNYATDMNYLAVQKFLENEKYTTIFIKENIKHLIKNKVSIIVI